MNFSSCTEKELWEYVATHLAELGIRNVLVGGAVAAIYSEGVYKSGDLDIVLDSYRYSKTTLKAGMKALGFQQRGRHWIHPNCHHLYVEFCPPPVSIGDDVRIEPIEIKKGGVSIYILSPTDCVKDRLAGYIHWKARECLDQAVLVAISNEVDLQHIKSWCRSEHKNGEKIFDEFKEKIKKA